MRAPSLSVSVVSRALSSPLFIFFLLPSSLLAAPPRSGIGRTRGGRRRHPGLGCAATGRGLDAHTRYASETFSRVQSITHFCPVPLFTPDERNLPPLNRIGDPDDILASVRVEGGKVGLPSFVVSWPAYGTHAPPRFLRSRTRRCPRTASVPPMASLSSLRGLHRSS